jgi:hypothetical protein
VIKVAAPLSPAVAQLALPLEGPLVAPLEAPLTTKQEVRRREKKCRKILVVRAKEIEQNLKTAGLKWTLENKPEVHLDE